MFSKRRTGAGRGERGKEKGSRGSGLVFVAPATRLTSHKDWRDSKGARGIESFRYRVSMCNAFNSARSRLSAEDLGVGWVLPTLWEPWVLYDCMADRDIADGLLVILEGRRREEDLLARKEV